MRTLIPDQAPIDMVGLQPGTAERRGFNLFVQTNCTICHQNQPLAGPPVVNAAGFLVDPNDSLFSDGAFHNIALPNHPPAQPQGVKTPTLRNVMLRNRLFSSGQAMNMTDALNQQYFVRSPPFGFGGVLSSGQTADLLAFFNALTDPRVAAEMAPFDRPTLRSEGPSNQFGNGSPGLGGFIPTMISNTPERIGNPQFKLGVGRGLGGAVANLLTSPVALPNQNFNGIPVHILLPVSQVAATVTLAGVGPGQGTATAFFPIPNMPALIGSAFASQWFVADANAAGGAAASSATVHQIF